MSKVYRAGVCLTSMKDTELNAIVVAAVWQGADFSEIELYAEQNRLYGWRKAVAYAASAIDRIEYMFTETTRIEPSEESKMWSNFEGGHTFHKRPNDDEIIGMLFK